MPNFNFAPVCLSVLVLQVEFVSEDETVGIVPNIRMDALNMICVRLPSTTHFHLFPNLF